MNIQNFRNPEKPKTAGRTDGTLNKTPEISKRYRGGGGVNAYDRAEVNKHNHFLLRSLDP